MDADGYPTEDEIERIKAWPYNDFEGLLEFVNKQCWWPAPDCGFRRFGDLYELATGGWSGNEEVIAALNRNPMFNALCWQSSHRGGLHVYKLSRLGVKTTASVTYESGGSTVTVRCNSCDYESDVKISAGVLSLAPHACGVNTQMGGSGKI